MIPRIDLYNEQFNLTTVIYLLTVNWLNTFIHIYIYPTPPLEQDMTQGQFLSGV